MSDCLTGILGSSGTEGYGFYRTDVQPKDDPRPYIESSLAAFLLGSSKSFFNLHKTAWLISDEVTVQEKLII